MTSLLPHWSRTQTWLALALLPFIAGMLLATWPATHPLAFAACYVVTLLLGLSLTPFVASMAGLVMAGVLVAVQQALGNWGSAPYAVHLAEVLLLPLTGLGAGWLGRHLQRPPRPRPTPDQAQDDDVLGPFAFLSAPYGKARLDEEIERAGLFNRPLSVVHVTPTFRDGHPLGREARLNLQRTVARVVEGMLRVTDIPFTYADAATGTRHLVCILPETSAADATLLVSLHEDAVDRATFTTARTEVRHLVRDYAEVRFAVASAPAQGSTADALLQTARTDAAALPAPAHQETAAPQA